VKALAVVACVGLLGASCSRDDGGSAAKVDPSGPSEPSAHASEGSVPTAATTAPTGSSEPSTESEPDAELDNEDIPVPEDYEEQVAEELTAENFEQELDKIERELAQAKAS